MNYIEYREEENIAIIAINNPPVNAMSIGVPGTVIEQLDNCFENEDIEAIVLTGAGSGTIAGADIREHGRQWPVKEAKLSDLVTFLDNASKPVVAFLQGPTLGGGLEIAMACHYRVLTSNAIVGQPEVNLGIPPGCGGTQRLPRLVGVDSALDMILTGKPIKAERALELGLADSVVNTSDNDTTNSATIDQVISFAKAQIGKPLPVTSDHEATLKDQSLLENTRSAIERKKRAKMAQLSIVDCLEAAAQLPFSQGKVIERNHYERCVVSDDAKALRHVFFAERASRSVPGVSKDLQPKNTGQVAIIGAGTMGGGIAMCFADAGIPVTVIDLNAEALDRGISTIRKNYSISQQRGKLSEEAMQQRLSLINASTNIEDAKNADIVIEAIFENMDVKKQLFSTLDSLCDETTILASNTSYLDINEIATAAPLHKGKVMGMHFFSPANRMKLLEVVRTKELSDENLLSGIKLGRRLKKLPIVAGVCHGFIANRMFECYLREANFLIEEGALPQQVDKALTDFGFPMGPFAVADLAGLDIGAAKRKANAHKRDPNKRYSIVADDLCEKGWFGLKTGRGFYQYNDGDRKPQPSAETEQIILAASEQLGITRRSISDEEIIARCLYTVVNQGAQILEEGIALRASDMDLVWINGYGFPRWKGGPMHWADQIGLTKLLSTIQDYQQQHDFWEPAPLLEELANENRSFSQFDQGVK